MSKDARVAVRLTVEAKQQLDECVAAMAACGFGADGPPKETTFAEIEDFGHEVGRMLARAVEEQVAQEHAAHFQQEAACPACGTACPVKEAPAEREFQSGDGPITLREPVCHCSVCHRDFFPSADGTGD